MKEAGIKPHAEVTQPSVFLLTFPGKKKTTTSNQKELIKEQRIAKRLTNTIFSNNKHFVEMFSGIHTKNFGIGRDGSGL